MKKIYFLMIALVLGALTGNAKTIYLDANVWNKDGAHFEAWAWVGDGAGQWYNFTSDFGSIYKAEMPDDITDMILLRKEPKSTNNWDNWNRIDNIKVSDTDNMCIVNDDWVTVNWGTFAYPNEIYILGYNNEWNPANPTALTKVDDETDGATYTAQITFTNASFKLSNKKSNNKDNWDSFNCGGINVGSNIVLGEETDFTSGSSVNNSLTETGTYYVYVDLINKTFLYTETATAIESVSVDANAPVEYYNLQGVKVANPENGLFIKKQGNKAVKVIL